MLISFSKMYLKVSWGSIVPLKIHLLFELSLQQFHAFCDLCQQFDWVYDTDFLNPLPLKPSTYIFLCSPDQS